MKKYPLPLKNGKEAKILQNFGDGICKILDERLQKHYRENGAGLQFCGDPEMSIEYPQSFFNLLASCLQSYVVVFFLKGSDAPIHLATSCHTSNMASSKQMEEPQKKPSGNLGEHMVGLRMK